MPQGNCTDGHGFVTMCLSCMDFLAQLCTGGRPQPVWAEERAWSSPHINFIKGGQHGTSVLSLFQALSNALTHPVHFHLKSKRP